MNKELNRGRQQGAFIPTEVTREHGAESKESVVALWNDQKGLEKVRSSAGRTRALAKQWKDVFFRKHWREAIMKVATSEFCKGKNVWQWKASFDWFVRADVIAKIMAGNYSWRTVK